MIFQKFRDVIGEHEELELKYIKRLKFGYYEIFVSVLEDGKLTFKTLRTNKITGREELLRKIIMKKKGNMIHVG